MRNLTSLRYVVKTFIHLRTNRSKSGYTEGTVVGAENVRGMGELACETVRLAGMAVCVSVIDSNYLERRNELGYCADHMFFKI